VPLSHDLNGFVAALVYGGGGWPGRRPVSKVDREIVMRYWVGFPCVLALGVMMETAIGVFHMAVTLLVVSGWPPSEIPRLAAWPSQSFCCSSSRMMLRVQTESRQEPRVKLLRHEDSPSAERLCIQGRYGKSRK
jgi:hypothetical protein